MIGVGARGALHCIAKQEMMLVSLERQSERETKTEREKVLSPAPQTCVTNPQGPSGRSVQDQSAPQQGRSTLLPFPHTVHECVYLCVCVTVLYLRECLCMCVTTELEQRWEQQGGEERWREKERSRWEEAGLQQRQMC